MESPETVIQAYSCCSDSFGKVLPKKPAMTRDEAIRYVMRLMAGDLVTFDAYICSSSQTINYDDVDNVITIPKDLFKRMVIHVCHSNISSSSGSEIISKILEQTIDCNTEQVAVTKKDWYYRLLAHIPWNGQKECHTCLPLLINQKIFLLKMDSCIHKQKEIKICDQHARLASPITDGDQIAEEFNKLIASKKLG